MKAISIPPPYSCPGGEPHLPLYLRGLGFAYTQGALTMFLCVLRQKRKLPNLSALVLKGLGPARECQRGIKEGK
jgi:hypothetical protein